MRCLRTVYAFELKKCINAKSTFAIFVMVAVGLILFALKTDSQMVQIPESKENLAWEVEEMRYRLNDPGYAISDRTEYINTLKAYEYMLEHDIAPYKTRSITNYLLTINNMFALVVILSVIIISRIITDEYRYSTMNILATIPAKRYKILLAKILGMITVCVAIIALIYIMSLLIGGIFFGFDGLFSPIVTCTDGTIHVRNVLTQSLLNNFYNLFTLIACGSLTLMLAIVLKNGIISACGGIVLYYMGSVLTIALKEYSWVKYTLFANMQFQMYVAGLELFEGVTPSFSIIVLLAYSAVFTAIAFLVFSKRNIYE